MKSVRNIICGLVFIGVFLCQAQDENPTLKAEDISRFIETFKPLTMELEALDDKVDGTQNMATLQAFVSSTKAMTILEKYGWDEKFVNVWMTISMAYGLVKMEEQLQALPEAQREQYKAVLSAQMDAQQMPYGVTEEDKKLVKDRMSDLDKLFENK